MLADLEAPISSAKEEFNFQLGKEKFKDESLLGEKIRGAQEAFDKNPLKRTKEERKILEDLPRKSESKKFLKILDIKPEERTKRQQQFMDETINHGDETTVRAIKNSSELALDVLEPKLKELEKITKDRRATRTLRNIIDDVKNRFDRAEDEALSVRRPEDSPELAEARRKYSDLIKEREFLQNRVLSQKVIEGLDEMGKSPLTQDELRQTNDFMNSWRSTSAYNPEEYNVFIGDVDRIPPDIEQLEKEATDFVDGLRDDGLLSDEEESRMKDFDEKKQDLEKLASSLKSIAVECLMRTE